MEKFDLGSIFQGISTLLQSDPAIMYSRIGLILLGILLVYLGRRGVLEPLVMIPMGLGMAAVNAGVLAVERMGAHVYSSVVIPSPHPQIAPILKRYSLENLTS